MGGFLEKQFSATLADNFRARPENFHAALLNVSNADGISFLYKL